MTLGSFVTASGCAAWVAAAPDSPIVDRLRRQLSEAVTVDDLLTSLTADGLPSTPGFVLVVEESTGLRLLVRGEAFAEVDRTDGTRDRVDAGRSVSWREEIIDDVARVRLGPTDGDGLEWVLQAIVADPVHESPIDAAVDESESPPDVGRQERHGGRAGGAVDDAGEHPEDVDVEHDAVEATERDESDRGDGGADAAPEESLIDEPPTLMGDDLEVLSGERDGASGPPPPPPEEDEFDFSNLLDRTQFRDVESAAVRPVDEAPEDDAAPATNAAEAAPPPPTPAGPSAEPPPPPPVGSPLISGIPGAAATPETPAQPSMQEPGPTAGDRPGDHDGHTISVAELRAMREGDAPAAESSPDPRPTAGASVQAIHCSAGHPNPPSARHCRACDVEIADETVTTVPRPVIARLRFDSGTVVELDRPQLIGRRPSVDGNAADGELPGLVTLPSPEAELSRVHIAVRLEGWSVLVEDFGSTNGTEIQLPGQDRVRLREHEPVLVVPGTEVILAEVIRFVIEVPRA